jgi:hypothetical protein
MELPLFAQRQVNPNRESVMFVQAHPRVAERFGIRNAP